MTEANASAVDGCDVSVVVPTYGGAAGLAQLHVRISQALGLLGITWELVLVDDASPDDTPVVARQITQADPRVRYMRLPRNQGQHRATVIGMAHARGRSVVTMDDDLQQAPESIPTLLAALRDDTDVVIARFSVSAHPGWRRAGSWLVNAFMTTSRRTQPLGITSFKAFRAEAGQKVLAAVPREGSFYLARVLLQVVPRSRIVNVDVPHYARSHGRSGYRPRDLLGLAWRALRSRG